MTRMERQGVTVKAGTQFGARPPAEPAVRGQLPVDDAEAGFEVGEGFERFSQKDDVFCRSFWDPVVRTSRSDMFYETYRTPELRWRPVDGFTRRDYALRNASWHVTDLFAEFRDGADRREGFLDPYTVLRDGPGPPDESDEPPEVLAARLAVELKTAARALGADLIGITGNDERWVYTHAYSRETETEKPQELPGELGNVVVIAQAMDRGLVQTVPSALSGTATGVGYSSDTVVLLAIAQYILNMGYAAVPTMNDTALAIPLAIKAGLGEYGRHGLLITKEFGPRVRLGKIFTDMPLAHDRPRRFGVRETCEVCRACSDACAAEGHRDGRTNGPRLQHFQHPRRQEVDDGCREVLPVLVEPEHRLLDLRQGLSLQPGLLQAPQPALAVDGGDPPAPARPLARPPEQAWTAGCAEDVVGDAAWPQGRPRARGRRPALPRSGGGEAWTAGCAEDAAAMVPYEDEPERRLIGS